ncbi:MAG TPA: hypothetical protein VGU45_17450 [Microvirga sp.]|jgi:ABC-type polysaccharide/polyol phosphate export permease|nr:hypothetical protein [Microvirga sp.]
MTKRPSGLHLDGHGSPVLINKPVKPTWWGFLKEIRHWMFLVPMLASFARAKVFSHMRLGMLWLVIRPAVLVAGVAALVANFINIPNANNHLLGSTILGLGFWYSFHRCLMHLGRSHIRLKTVARDFPAVPRFILVLAGFGPALVEAGVVMGVSLLCFAIVTVVQDGTIHLASRFFVLAPTATLVVALFAIAFSLVVSHLTDEARDTWLFYKYFLNAVFLLTPILYPITAVPASLLAFVWINPFSGAVEAFRAAFLPIPLNVGALAFSAATSLAAVLVSLYVSFRFERRLR